MMAALRETTEAWLVCKRGHGPGRACQARAVGLGNSVKLIHDSVTLHRPRAAGITPSLVLESSHAIE